MSASGRKLAAKRQKVRQAVEEAGASNLRVFGSVARGEDTTSSDIDLLIDISESFSLVDLARLQDKIERILNHTVDIIPTRGLKGSAAMTAFKNAVPL